MFHFGFSYIGLLYLLMLFIPNIMWMKRKPENYEQYQKKESKVLSVFEKIGEITTSCSALIFSDFNIRKTYWIIWLILSFGLMLLYELYWIQYFKSQRKMSDFYKKVCGVPVAGATLPVFAFFLLGIYGCNIFLIVSTIILGIGHIGIHRNHYKEISDCVQKKKLRIRILKWCGMGLLTIIFGIMIYIIGRRNIEYIQHYINMENGVDEGIYVSLCDQEQYVLIRGENTENPIVVYLHGGPSSPDTFITYAFADELMDDYTIVGWDQRGCGRTYYRNKNLDIHNDATSFDQALEDLDALVDYLCNRFAQEKVIIMGHSYGTILGSEYASTHPQKVAAYIGVAQVLSMEETDEFSYQDAFAKAETAGDDTTEMVAAFKQYQMDTNLTYAMKLRQATSAYHPVELKDQTTWMAVSSPYFGMNDFWWFLKQLGDFDDYYILNKQLFDYTCAFDVKTLEWDHTVPAYFISGSDDWVCPIIPIEQYVDGLHADKKEFLVISGCGHNVQYTKPTEFSNLVKQVLGGKDL